MSFKVGRTNIQTYGIIYIIHTYIDYYKKVLKNNTINYSLHFLFSSKCFIRNIKLKKKFREHLKGIYLWNKYCYEVYLNYSNKYFQKRVLKVFRILFNIFQNINVCIFKTEKNDITILCFYTYFEQTLY